MVSNSMELDSEQIFMKIAGKIKKHLGRGKRLGFPTANLDVETDLDEGVYLGLAILTSKDSPLRKGESFGLPSLVFIGASETFGEQEKRIEVYILDFNQDIYSRELEVEIIKKIRDNQKFETEQELIEQMKQDELVAREFFASYNIGN